MKSPAQPLIAFQINKPSSRYGWWGSSPILSTPELASDWPGRFVIGVIGFPVGPEYFRSMDYLPRFATAETPIRNGTPGRLGRIRTFLGLLFVDERNRSARHA
jgi:hypothetical protein